MSSRDSHIIDIEEQPKTLDFYRRQSSKNLLMVRTKSYGTRHVPKYERPRMNCSAFEFIIIILFLTGLVYIMEYFLRGE